MSGHPLDRPLLVFVGAGGVGKTTLAAATAVDAARAGNSTLVMTFDPSLRLKDALGVGEAAREREVQVALEAAGRLSASLLDAQRTFDRLIEQHAPDAQARERILGNRFYRHLSGSLGGILEYMAVERLFEVAAGGEYERIVLDTPPTRQALDFLEAPQRIVGFLDSGAVRLALRPWFDEDGRLKTTSRWGGLGRRVEDFLDDVVGLDLLRDMAEFFQAFRPLYDGFRERAAAVEELLRSPRTRFILVAGPGEEAIPDAMYFARRLIEAKLDLGAVVVNRVHPRFANAEATSSAPLDPLAADGRDLLVWRGERDARGIAAMADRLGPQRAFCALPLRAEEPTHLEALAEVGAELRDRLTSQ